MLIGVGFATKKMMKKIVKKNGGLPAPCPPPRPGNRVKGNGAFGVK